VPAIATIAVALQYHSAYAGGFALIEQGGSGMGNAYAGASAVSADASTVWFNPAGMLELEGPQLAVAGHLIAVENGFSDRGTTLNPRLGLGPVPGVTETDPGGNTIVPNFYYVREIKNDLAFGLGVSVPFGNSTDYGRDWVGRYQAVESSVSVIDINPSLAYRVNEQLSIGGGISVQMFDATLGSAIDSSAVCLGLAANGTIPGAACANSGLTSPGNFETDGYAEITGDSVAATFNFGVLYKPQEATRLGFAYRHSVDHELEGEADFTNNENLAAILGSQIPLFLDVAATAEANLPSSAMFSVAHRVNDKLELLADATFTAWSSLEELRIVFDNPLQDDSFNTLAYEDVWRFAVGLNYRHNEQLTLRTGVALDQDPVPSAQLRTPRIPGDDRRWLSFGASYRVSDQVGFDVGYAHLFVDEVPIANEGENTGGSTIRGVFDANINLVSAQFNYYFK
jgi:long-chain fatty acid transport protein